MKRGRLLAIAAATWLLSSCALDTAPTPFTPEQALAERFTREELLADTEFLVQTIRDVHPQPYSQFDRADVVAARARLGDALQDNMSRVDYWRLVAPFVALFRDGHTRIGQPLEEWEWYRTGGPNLFPLALRFDSVGATVRSALSPEQHFASGTRIHEVNDRTVADLMSDGMAIFPFEQDRLRLWALNSRQTQLFALLWGWMGPFDVVAETPDGDRLTATVRGITAAEWNAGAETAGLRPAVAPAAPYSYALIAEGQLGYLDFRAHTDADRFTRFLREAFMSLQEQAPRALVIDLRNNPGGSSELNEQLLAYLTDRPVRQYSRIDVRASAIVKEEHRRRIPRPLRWLPAGFLGLFEPRLGSLLSAPDGALVSWVDDERSAGAQPLRWRGPVYALVGLNTFSAAADLAAVLQDYGIATLVGEETGGLASAHGDYHTVLLPHTRLRLDVSTKFYVRPSGVVDLRGVVPEVVVTGARDAIPEQDVAIRAVLQRLTSRASAGTLGLAMW
jgi:hypothetical protein